VTPADAAQLLAYIAAFDRRTIGEADAHAWSEALADIPLDGDVRAAVAAHYGTTDQWLTPALVRAGRQRIRNARVDAAVLVDSGRPDETGAEWAGRRRLEVRAAVDGAVPARTPVAALDPAPAGRRGAQEFAQQVGRSLDDLFPGRAQRRAERPELAVDCPVGTCRARAWRRCRTPSGREIRTDVHASRRDAYQAQGGTR